MWRWYRDHEFSLLDGNPYPSSLGAIEGFIRSLPAPSYSDVSLGIEIEDRELIGIVRLKRGAQEDRRADFGIAIERARWEQGYGTDTTRTILRFAFEEMGLHRVELGVLDSNERAHHVYAKCGFRDEARLRQRHYRLGAWRDVILMGILRDEFQSALVSRRDAAAMRRDG